MKYDIINHGYDCAGTLLGFFAEYIFVLFGLGEGIRLQ